MKIIKLFTKFKVTLIVLILISLFISTSKTYAKNEIEINGPERKLIKQFLTHSIKSDHFLIYGKVSHNVPKGNLDEPVAYFETLVYMLNPISHHGTAQRIKKSTDKYGVTRHLEGKSENWRDFAIPFFYNSKKEKPESIELYCVIKGAGNVKVKDVKLTDGKNLKHWSKFSLIPIQGWWKPEQTFKIVTYIFILLLLLGAMLVFTILIGFLIDNKKIVNLTFLSALALTLFFLLVGLYGFIHKQPWWITSTFMFFSCALLIITIISWYTVNISLFNGKLLKK